jgi:ubiquinone/menaquinone biosynthesis C-methylase UbiE
MKRKTLVLLACPTCRGGLSLNDQGGGETIETGTLVCVKCQRQYPIQEGIVHFIKPEELTGLNGRFARFYDRFTRVYFLFNKAAFLFLGGVRRSRKKDIIDRLELTGGRVLEVSIGPGINLPYLFEMPGKIDAYGLDISLGQLHHCQDFCRKRGLEVELFLGTAEALPFKDNAFEATFHIGGINFFGDRKAAIDEMIRVARPGTKIAIADENEQAAQSLDWLPGFGGLFEKKRETVTTPVDLVPVTMQEIKADSIWKGTGWVVEFRKPE